MRNVQAVSILSLSLFSNLEQIVLQYPVCNLLFSWMPIDGQQAWNMEFKTYCLFTHDFFYSMSVIQRMIQNWRRRDHWSLHMAEAIQICCRTQMVMCNFICSTRLRNLSKMPHTGDWEVFHHNELLQNIRALFQPNHPVYNSKWALILYKTLV